LKKNIGGTCAFTGGQPERKKKKRVMQRLGKMSNQKGLGGGLVRGAKGGVEKKGCVSFQIGRGRRAEKEKDQVCVSRTIKTLGHKEGAVEKKEARGVKKGKKGRRKGERVFAHTDNSRAKKGKKPEFPY